ncbi:phenazine biosynthesis-like domain-containing protein isoform X1 [Lingula anatina]|uniref:Phenazine biosynthesis-like domain-containing protein isoform X1 n=2 Tax=Lingula anatina TaxID=7574 RepID=A0A1S3K035_LINAN|nr:phenazine biosynthesis-like domain-containing protein isoform X1 [Lingula anatina]|eukprot:XP_013415993.1 phenazine biosynthesis-like domain-containing protein isoform X1 [Lingula anatina]
MAAPIEGRARSSKSMSFPLYTVDAFTNKPFAGNPAAVCLVKHDQVLDDETMQKLATEMNLSETAFVRTLSATEDFQSGSRYGLRWMTPTIEVALCGHATLASAAVLFFCLNNPSPELTFVTLSGELKARRCDPFVSLDLPLNSCEPETVNDAEELIKLTIGGFAVKELQHCAHTKDLLILLEENVTRLQLESMQPHVDQMIATHNTGRIKGVIVTLGGSEGNGCVDSNGKVYDFVSRYFAPWNGIKEDPVTGSAHTVLSSYWSKKLGKKALYARQCSPRGGDLKIQVRDDGRVDIAGEAAIVMSGNIFI